jgi:hypothetical protein
MNVATSIRILVAALSAAGVVASSALAAGEPKNAYPFTRIVGGDRIPLATSTHLARRNAITGERKNTLPFTRR